MEHGPGLKMYFLLKMGDLPAIAMLVYQEGINKQHLKLKDCLGPPPHPGSGKQSIHFQEGANN